MSNVYIYFDWWNEINKRNYLYFSVPGGQRFGGSRLKFTKTWIGITLHISDPFWGEFTGQRWNHVNVLCNMTFAYGLFSGDPVNMYRREPILVKYIWGRHFPCYWPFVWGIHRSLVDSPHKDQWRRISMFSLICAWTNGWANNRHTGDFRRYRAHYDVTVICFSFCRTWYMLYQRLWYVCDIQLYSTELTDRFIRMTDVRHENIVEYTRTTHVDSGGMCV